MSFRFKLGLSKFMSGSVASAAFGGISTALLLGVGAPVNLYVLAASLLWDAGAILAMLLSWEALQRYAWKYLPMRKLMLSIAQSNSCRKFGVSVISACDQQRSLDETR